MLPGSSCLPKLDYPVPEGKQLLGEWQPSRGTRDMMVAYLWHVFRSVQQGSPFILSYPFKNSNQQLFDHLVELSRSCNLTIKGIVKLFRTSSEADNAVLKNGVKIFGSFQELAAATSVPHGRYFLYCADSSLFRTLTTDPQFENRLFNCDGLNPVLHTAVNDHKAPPDHQQKLEMHCQNLVRKRLESIEAMLEHLKKQGLTLQDISVCFV